MYSGGGCLKIIIKKNHKTTSFGGGDETETSDVVIHLVEKQTSKQKMV